jgi:adenylate kinase family enzyme
MIIGSPGTGKSVFGKKLASKVDIPLIHLDYFYHDKAHDYYNDKQAWKAKVEVLTNQDSWIIDGNYGSTMAERMERADAIFYFDMPRRIAIWGIIKRRISAFHTKRTDMPEGWSEKADLEFIRYVWNFKKQFEEATLKLLERNKKKNIVIFVNHRQTDQYLTSLKDIN